MPLPFPLLSAPLAVGAKTVKNRIVVPPMADFGATGPDGMVTDRHLRHYGAFAAGGAGLIVIEACAVSEMREPRHTLGLFSDACLPGMARLAEAARANRAIALVQLVNTGLEAMTETSIADIGWDAFLRYKADFVAAARLCRKAGFDGVTLHAAHGFYLNQVVETSARRDEYGGCFENRVRLVCELIAEIKAECGDDFIVSVRFGNRSMPELLQEAEAFEAAGADMLDVSSGMSDYLDVPGDFPFDGTVYAASRVGKVAGIPVIAVGNIATGGQAERILSNGLADLVAVGRGHLCDPAWADKTLSGSRPTPCRDCRMCLWYLDGQRCPSRIEG